MKATGEVMAMDRTFGLAFYKSQEAAGTKLPLSGNVLITVSDKNKEEAFFVIAKLKKMGFNIYATENTSRFLGQKGVEVIPIKKLHEGRPNIADAIKNKEINLIINTPIGKNSKYDDSYIRIMAIQHKIPYITTMAAARVSIEGIEEVRRNQSIPKSLQDYHKEREEAFRYR